MSTQDENPTGLPPASTITAGLPPALLAMEDGTIYRGFGFGAESEGAGEIVFNTAITGYQEVITDPSYRGQIVTMTAPEIGNVGVNPVDFESSRAWCAGFVVRDLSPAVSNWRASGSLHALLRDAGVAAITGIDTRAVTRRLRISGAQRGVITRDARDLKEPALAVARARKHPSLEGRDLVKEVTTDKSYTWNETIWCGPRPGDPNGALFADATPARHRVVAYDFGMKRGILRRLRSSGCEVTVVPAATSAKDVLSLKPDGVFLSNGPGDPAAVEYAVEAARTLCESKLPIFGICLGHQILGLALGGKTYKLKFGHHGANHPVMDLHTQKVEITSQNHGFAVDVDSMEGRAVLSHVSLNDKTVEGMRHGTLPIFSVQYHPEASPGPNDASYLFDRFTALMDERRRG
ncbi:MAG TPA: glutamine-hydrolyzing carbamoyl-phosphate synthase small subunit [Polyangia bacterium]|nr:glutamine-hydrolyzing carbamoyl-phosphate synthase small subunit [Polyangia bacterium]